MTKTYNNLYPSLVSFGNLFAAAKRAQAGKRFHPVTAAFNHNMESELFQLQEELSVRAYRPGKYAEFFVYDPKKRLICAAPYRDRVVHHTLCAIIEPIFERTFIFDSYACRVGKGQHKATDRFTEFSRVNEYVLKFDVSRYFASVDHEILKTLIRRRIRCRNTLWLIDLIIDSGRSWQGDMRYFGNDDLFAPIERRRGIPIGNLTSQLFANLYLDSLDHHMKENLQCKHYIRYMDDVAIFSQNKAWLHDVQQMAMGWLADNLRLAVSERKCRISPVRCGTNFLGYIMYPGHRRLRRPNIVRFKRRMRKKQQDFADTLLSAAELGQSIQSWIAHASHADTFAVRKQVLGALGFSRKSEVVRSRSKLARVIRGGSWNNNANNIRSANRNNNSPGNRNNNNGFRCAQDYSSILFSLPDSDSSRTA